MLGSVVQRLARNAVSAARLSNWSFGASPPGPGGLPVWHGVADSLYSTQRWQHPAHSLATALPPTLGTRRIHQQQLLARNPSAAANIPPCMQQQRLRSGAATSTASDAAADAAARQAPAPAAPSATPMPWTPTDQLQKRKILPKRMGHLLAELEQEQVQRAMAAKALPDFGPGDNLQLKLSVPENRRRVAVVQGICIARRNRAWRTSFTIRNHIGTAGGIERTFPLFSPNIQEIVVLDSKRVRRAKLYYLRERQPKEYRVSTKT